MKRTIATAAAAAAVLALSVGPANAAHGRGDQTVGMNGANEVGTQGDKDGSGKIELSFFAAVDNPSVVFPGEPYICYELTTRKVGPATGLHIHEVDGNTTNPRKDTGDVVVNLLAGAVQDGDATCVATTTDVLDGILADPSEYYVNYHTAENPSGAIRGQLHAFS